MTDDNVQALTPEAARDDAIAIAQSVVVELDRRGVNSEVHFLSESDLATVKVRGHDRYSFMVATTDDVEGGPGWAAVLNTPADDDPDLCIQVESKLDRLAARASASDVADGIVRHITLPGAEAPSVAASHSDR